MGAIRWEYVTTAKLMQLSMDGEFTSNALVRALCKRLARSE